VHGYVCNVHQAMVNLCTVPSAMFLKLIEKANNSTFDKNGHISGNFGDPGPIFAPRIPENGLPIFSANCAPVWVSDSFGPKISGERAAHRSLRTLKRVAGVGVLPCFSGFVLCFFCALHRWQNSDFLKGPGVSFLALLAFRGLLFVVCLVFGGLTWSLIGAKWARCLFAFRC